MNEFDKAQRPRWNDTEPWGENEHGCFSLLSGKFIPKEDKSYAGAPEISITWPGELQKSVKDEKNERY